MNNSLTYLSKTCCYNKHGYYILEDNGVWSFLAKEQKYSSSDLLDIMNTLNILNET